MDKPTAVEHQRSSPQSPVPTESTSDTATICQQCRTTNFEHALNHIEANREEPLDPCPVTIAERTGLDAACPLCGLFARLLLPNTYASSLPPGSQERWRLRAFNLRNWLLESKTRMLYSPATAAVLYAGERERDWLPYVNSEEVERTGFLVCARTRDLEAAVGSGAGEEEGGYPLSRFVGAEYEPEMVRSWLNLTEAKGDSAEQSESESESEDEDEIEGEEEDEDDILEAAHKCGDEIENYERVQRPFHGVQVVTGMKVIDCETHMIVSKSPDMQYVALSYVWALALQDTVELGREGEPEYKTRLPRSIPRVVRDAMTVVTQSGYRYLWVDAYCIDQSNPTEVADQVSKMDLIYGSAAFTIVAASSRGNLPGVGGSPRTPQTILKLGPLTIFTTPPPVDRKITASTWFTRGWCFQESLLSPRRLYFADHEALFAADGLHACDSFPVHHPEVAVQLDDSFPENPSLTPASWDRRLRRARTKRQHSLADPRGRFWVELGLFLGLVEVYTGKQFTMSSDSINGFRGAMRILVEADANFATLQGVPVFVPRVRSLIGTDYGSEPLRRFQKKAFVVSLGWCHKKDDTVSRREEFPSWTWAGWRGSARWDGKPGPAVSGARLQPLGFDVIAVQGTRGTLLPWAKALSFFTDCLDEDARLLLGEAVGIPVGNVLFRRQGKPTDALRQDDKWAVRWDMDFTTDGPLDPASQNLELEIERFLASGQWGLILLSYEYTVRMGRKEDRGSALVVCWDRDEREQIVVEEREFRKCYRIGSATIWRGNDLGSAAKDILDTYPRISFGLG
ncbi:heterokaryon incompatibility protein-domain-containing protein [Annulohypoxylon truncatum]|uniref:heterokaryon incompatibility protein-domain-containing protein n=1 Tax=Annulohypoxylon truncatum TaxID=327061 RepID=UPI00200824BD|nr:heterokaryon incompatibility protein-domain-containing protein [Annulohypoxylon truncatum]KAI1214584.1 heterokaryon incompatibility protein-domain-containing protein [Annulohypoxylon truncatum]